MTGFTGGFDDWQGQSLWRTSGWTDATYDIAANVNLFNNYLRGSSFGAVMIELTAVTNSVSVQLLHSRTNPDAEPHVSHTWCLRPGVRLLCTVPLLSNYFGFKMSSPTAVGCSVRVRTQRLNIGIDKTHYYAPVREFGALNDTIAAGTSRAYAPAYLLPGPGTLNWSSPSGIANVFLTIDSLDQNGSIVTRFIDINGNNGNGSRPVQFPLNSYQVTMVNQNAAPQTMSFAIAHLGD